MESSTLYLPLCSTRRWGQLSKLINSRLADISPGMKRKWVMRLNLLSILILATCLHMYAAGYSQRISINERNTPLEKVLDKIEKQSGYSFFLQTDLLAKSNKVSLHLKNASLETVLNELFRNQPLSYSIVSKTIVIKKKEDSASDKTTNYPSLPTTELRTGLNADSRVEFEKKISEILIDRAQTIKPALVPIIGRVTDEKGEGMPGVSIVVKGTQKGTTSDSRGQFQLDIAERGVVLVFSFVGYESQEVPVGSQSTLNVTLRVSEKGLQEVVVVGYGEQRKSDVTGATSTVSAKEIAKRPLVRVEQALQGTTSGVVVASSSGQPGRGLNVRIRGSNSITGSNDPLYVIDGFIGGNIESINPNDIESLEILKDASSTAIYGSRGSNGVVLITTKSGQEGKAKVNFSTWFSRASVPKKLSLMNAYDFARTVNTQFASTGNPPAFSDDRLQTLKANGGTDWQNELHQEPLIQNYQLDVSGGSANVKYLISANYLDQPGLILNQYYKRATLRANIDAKINDRLNVKFNVAAVIPQNRNTNYSGDLTDPFTQATEWDPTSPVRDPATGAFILTAPYASIQYNPVARATSQFDESRNTNLAGTGILTYRILDGLTFTTNTTYQISSPFNQTLFGPGTGNGVLYAQVNASRNWNFQNSNFLTYKGNFGDHALTVTALYEQQQGQGMSVTARANSLSTYALGYYNLSLGTSQQTSSGYSADALQSYMGRVNYAYKDKYLLTASVRTDGSSHLTQKYSTFPSLALGWNVSKESFFQNSKLFSDLKLRASYGQTGNQAVGAYATIAQVTTGGSQPAYYYDGSTPSVATPLGSPVSSSLKWETTTQYDIGLDASFLNGRLRFTADAYHKNISNLLYSYQAPFYLGGGNYLRNIGSVENKGLEFSLSGTPIATGKVRWTSNFNISFNRNKVTDLGGLDNVIVNGVGSALNSASILRVGRPLGEFYGYQFLGTWKTSEADQAALFGMKPGDAKYVDVDGDHAYTAADRVPIGNGTPKYSFGFINDVSYGNFTLSFMFQGTHGNQIYSQTLAYLWGGLGDQRNATTTEALNIWTSSNQTDNPAFSNTSKNFNNSSRYVYDGSYTKLKNLSLNYRIPDKLLTKAKIRSLEVYVSGQNLFTITKYPGYDPEVSNGTNAITQGLEMGVIPNPRTYTVGLRLGL
ncbi:SusC/RagA family TonB-linked outer membrane protein [Spirosoma sp. HMF4905]|uniref:SusC/RagA family TonB-linked outer membrane protein n=1 Tax=Spirosoma arboris TaxID=2682092 RepID=A0A7K1S4P7_9BACT|nr:TonB-dependent receptor [Spirosoma arboris]MVM28558.1 SusC/RagA family TonB-linked outer membrane protein [Spirosoma arboris]